MSVVVFYMHQYLNAIFYFKGKGDVVQSPGSTKDSGCCILHELELVYTHTLEQPESKVLQHGNLEPTKVCTLNSKNTQGTKTV